MPEYDSFRNILRDAYAEGCRRCEADLWEFVQPLNGWIDELLERPLSHDWRRSLDDYLAEQVPKGYTFEPYSLPLLVKHIESRARRHGLLPEQQKDTAPSPTETDDVLSPFVTTVIPNVSGPSESSAPSNGQGATFVDDVEVAGPGPTVTESYKAKVQKALDTLDPRIGNWWKANSVQGQIRSRDTRFWQFSYYTKLEANDQPFIYVDQSFTAGQTAQAIIADVAAGWSADSIGAYYKKYRFAQTGDLEEFRAWQKGAAGEAARLASLMAELYVGSVATLSPAGDLVVTIGDIADNGLHWGQLLSVLPLVGHLPITAIVFKIGKRRIKISKSIAKRFNGLSAKRRKALLARAAAAKTDDEAAGIIRRGLTSRENVTPSVAQAVSGRWVLKNEGMSARARAYQNQVGGRTGQVYKIGDAEYDGFVQGLLIEAKGPGFENKIKGSAFLEWFRGQGQIVEQARKQSLAAAGRPLEWHVAEAPMKPVLERLFKENGITGIQVIHTPAH